MSVHVSIHDVSPAWEPEIRRAIAMTRDAGVRPALLVVPNFHDESPLLEHAPFCAWLRELEADGHEVYLHGFFHQAGVRGVRSTQQGARTPPQGSHGLRWLFAQHVVSGGEAEFSDVSREEASARLDEGERVLREAGLTIRGFVAPAWSMPSWVMPMLAERGYEFTEDHLHIYNPVRRRRRPSLVLNFASRTPGRLASSVAFCRIARPARRVLSLPARIAIHPGDMRSAILRHEVRSLLRWGQGDFVQTGSELLA